MFLRGALVFASLFAFYLPTNAKITASSKSFGQTLTLDYSKVKQAEIDPSKDLPANKSAKFWDKAHLLSDRKLAALGTANSDICNAPSERQLEKVGLLRLLSLVPDDCRKQLLKLASHKQDIKLKDSKFVITVSRRRKYWCPRIKYHLEELRFVKHKDILKTIHCSPSSFSSSASRKLDHSIEANAVWMLSLLFSIAIALL